MEQRAKELIETIGLSQLIPIVTKYASKIKRFHLADSLAPLLSSFEEQVSTCSVLKVCKNTFRTVHNSSGY